MNLILFLLSFTYFQWIHLVFGVPLSSLSVFDIFQIGGFPLNWMKCENGFSSFAKRLQNGIECVTQWFLLFRCLFGMGVCVCVCVWLCRLNLFMFINHSNQYNLMMNNGMKLSFKIACFIHIVQFKRPRKSFQWIIANDFIRIVNCPIHQYYGFFFFFFFCKQNESLSLRKMFVIRIK